MKKAAKSLDGLDALVHDLLTISQMETGAITMHLETFDLVKLVEEVFDQFEGKADKKDIRMKFSQKTELANHGFTRISKGFIRLS